MGFFSQHSKQETQTRLDQLVEAVTRLMQDVDRVDALPFKLARGHVEIADKNCGSAIKNFSEHRFAICSTLIDKAELHLHMCRVLMASNETDPLDIHFAPASAHSCIVDLCNSIADLKFSVEYNNAAIAEGHKQTLITIVDLWWEACDSLANDLDSTARRFAEVGLLLLNILVLNVNLENEDGSATVSVRKTFSNPLFNKIREFAERLAESDFAIDSAGDSLISAREHFKEAVQDLNNALSHLVANEDNEADTNVAAGFLELKYVQRLLEQSPARKTASRVQKQNPIDIENLQEKLSDQLQAAESKSRKRRAQDWQRSGVKAPASVDPMLDEYNNIVELLLNTRLPAERTAKAVSSLQSAMRFTKLAHKQRADLRFADELCEQALTDLSDASDAATGHRFADI